MTGISIFGKASTTTAMLSIVMKRENSCRRAPLERRERDFGFGVKTTRRCPRENNQIRHAIQTIQTTVSTNPYTSEPNRALIPKGAGAFARNLI